MHSKLSRRLIESTLIKMLTETFWIYERGLALREKKQHSARAEVTICQVLSRCTVPHMHAACTYAHGLPHTSPHLLNFFCSLFGFCDSSCCYCCCMILFYYKIQLSHLFVQKKKGKKKKGGNCKINISSLQKKKKAPHKKHNQGCFITLTRARQLAQPLLKPMKKRSAPQAYTPKDRLDKRGLTVSKNQ